MAKGSALACPQVCGSLEARWIAPCSPMPQGRPAGADQSKCCSSRLGTHLMSVRRQSMSWGSNRPLNVCALGLLALLCRCPVALNPPSQAVPILCSITLAGFFAALDRRHLLALHDPYRRPNLPTTTAQQSPVLKPPPWLVSTGRLRRPWRLEQHKESHVTAQCRQRDMHRTCRGQTSKYCT